MPMLAPDLELFFFLSRRLSPSILKMKAWLQNAVSISPVTQKSHLPPPALSNFYLSNIGFICSVVGAFCSAHPDGLGIGDVGMTDSAVFGQDF